MNEPHTCSSHRFCVLLQWTHARRGGAVAPRASMATNEHLTMEGIAAAKTKAAELRASANRTSTKKRQELELWKDDQRQTALLRYGIISNVRVERYIQRKLRTSGSKLSARDRLYQFMYSPSSSGGALAFAFAISCCNIASAAIHALHSLSPWATAIDDSTHGLGLEAAHIALTTVFVAELLLRMIAAPNWKVVVLDGFFWLDVACVTPIFVRIGRYSDPLSNADASARLFVRCLEALGPLRLLKMCRFLHNAALLVAAVVNTLGALPGRLPADPVVRRERGLPIPYPTVAQHATPLPPSVRPRSAPLLPLPDMYLGRLAPICLRAGAH